VCGGSDWTPGAAEQPNSREMVLGIEGFCGMAERICWDWVAAFILLCLQIGSELGR
jgi:hypothetical protein